MIKEYVDPVSYKDLSIEELKDILNRRYILIEKLIGISEGFTIFEDNSSMYKDLELEFKQLKKEWDT